MKRILSALFFMFLPLGAGAHPHIFIDTGISFLVDKQGRLVAIKVEWAYDAMYSMLVISDLQVDVNSDGVVSVEEQAKLKGFDMNWIDGFDGDLYASQGGRQLAFGPPMKDEAMIDDGRLISTHIRPLKRPVDMRKGPVSVKTYDPTYYTAYTLDLGAEVIGTKNCKLEQHAADIGKAYDLAEQLLYGDVDEQTQNAQSPGIGEQFADTLILSCDTSS